MGSTELMAKEKIGPRLEKWAAFFFLALACFGVLANLHYFPRSGRPYRFYRSPLTTLREVSEMWGKGFARTTRTTLTLSEHLKNSTLRAASSSVFYKSEEIWTNASLLKRVGNVTVIQDESLDAELSPSAEKFLLRQPGMDVEFHHQDKVGRLLAGTASKYYALSSEKKFFIIPESMFLNLPERR